MATLSTVPIEYLNSYADGSAAIDLNRIPAFELPVPEETAEVRPEIETAVEPKARPRTRTAAQPAGISVFSVISVAAVAVCFVLMLLSYIQLSSISRSTAQMETTLAELKEEEAKLTVRYEEAFKLPEVESYATSQLGMIYLTEGQTVHLNGTLGNKAVILSDSTSESGGLLSELRSYILSMTDCFN